MLYYFFLQNVHEISNVAYVYGCLFAVLAALEVVGATKQAEGTTVVFVFVFGDTCNCFLCSLYRAFIRSIFACALSFRAQVHTSNACWFNSVVIHSFSNIGGGLTNEARGQYDICTCTTHKRG